MEQQSLDMDRSESPLRRLGTVAYLPINDIRVGTRIRATGDVTGLMESIRELGLLNPISVTEDGRLIAGMHRLTACKSLGWQEMPAIVLPISGLRGELAEIDENLVRNDLSTLERGKQLARRQEIYQALHPETRGGVAGGLARQGAANEIISFAEDTAKKTGVTMRTVQQEVQIATNLATDVIEAIIETETAGKKNELLAMSRLKHDEQRAVVARVESGDAKNFRQAINQVTQEKAREQAGGLPPGRFDVIYADPPWKYGDCEPSRAVDKHYPPMELTDICALAVHERPVQDLFADDAVLFLWATSAMLPEALSVVAAWGFTYKTLAVWKKGGAPGMGFYWRQDHELLLLGVRGRGQKPSEADRPSSVIEAVKTAHSAKPVEGYQHIERMYPHARKIELFARATRHDWKGWGNGVADERDSGDGRREDGGETAPSRRL